MWWIQYKKKYSNFFQQTSLIVLLKFLSIIVFRFLFYSQFFYFRDELVTLWLIQFTLICLFAQYKFHTKIYIISGLLKYSTKKLINILYFDIFCIRANKVKPKMQFLFLLLINCTVICLRNSLPIVKYFCWFKKYF